MRMSAEPVVTTRRVDNKLPVSVVFSASVVVVVAALALPFVISEYHLLQATFVLIYAIALLGLNLLIGYSGQLSLGHGAFYAIGAYIVADLINHAGIPYWGAIPIAALASFACGLVFGLPALRLEGHYLALATFALALAVPQLLKHPLLARCTGGFMGLSVSPVRPPPGIPLRPDQWLYFLCFFCAILLFWAARNLVLGRSGRALVALREHAIAARTMGINPSLYKTTVFGLSAMYAGIAGGLSALATQFISPDSFDFFLSLSFVVGVVVGGIATISGAIYGAIFIEFVPDTANLISKSAAWAVYGIVLIVCMYLFPSGIAGAVRKLSKPKT